MAEKLDTALKILTVGSAAVALFAAWRALPLDAEIKRLQSQTQQLDNDLKIASARLKEAENRLKETESGRKLSFDLYQEVRKILERKDKTPRDEEALRVLIESLAEDPFRYKLLGVLSVTASTPEVKKSAGDSSTFYKDEAAVAASGLTARVQTEPNGSRTALGSMDVDVFFCAAKQGTSEAVAKAVFATKQSGETGRWRLRLLPDSVNQQPGYGVTSSQIRYNAPEETDAAKSIAERMAKLGYNVQLRESQQPTKWYLSVFVCQ